MEYLGCNDMQHILRSARIGVWRVEFEAGRAPRVYADRVMDELLGISGDVTPEKRFLYHRAHIHKEDQELFEEYAAKLAKEPTEIVYRFIHPITGEMYVRCGGKRESGSADTVRIVGTHQDISDTARLEKSKQAERRLAELNQTLKKEHILHEGTTFTVTLTHRIAEHAGTKKADTQKEALDAAVLAGIRILLVEDNALNAEIAETILQDAGIIVEHAINGAQALAMVEKAPMGYYDLILMDIQMPCMDGYESTRRIRKLPDERSQTPIVAMTAHAFEEDRKAAFAVGMNGYVVKPIELPVLMETMAAVLPQAGSHQKK